MNKTKALGILEIFVAIGAIPAGLSMIIYTDGTGLGMPLDMISGSPFTDFFIPGLFLLSVIGIFQTIAAFFLFKQIRHAGKMGMSVGLVLISWICLQVYFIGLIHFLQPFYLIIGIFEVCLGYSIYLNSLKE